MRSGFDEGSQSSLLANFAEKFFGLTGERQCILDGLPSNNRFVDASSSAEWVPGSENNNSGWKGILSLVPVRTFFQAWDKWIAWSSSSPFFFDRRDNLLTQ